MHVIFCFPPVHFLSNLYMPLSVIIITLMRAPLLYIHMLILAPTRPVFLSSAPYITAILHIPPLYIPSARRQ